MLRMLHGVHGVNVRHRLRYILSALRITVYKSFLAQGTYLLLMVLSLFISDEMDGIPVSGLAELENHMEKLSEAPDTLVNAKLFDDVELQLTGRFVQLSTTTNKMAWLFWQTVILVV